MTQHTSNGDRAKDNDKLSMKAMREAKNTLEQTLTNVGAHRYGLTIKDAEERLATDGPNEVAHDKPPHIIIQLLLAFKNPFIFVLMTLAAISFVTDYWIPHRDGEETELTGVIIILVMIALSGLLRFWQEFRSARAAESLKSMVRTTATVRRRDNQRGKSTFYEVPLSDLVVGDIIRLTAGDMIPADIRLIESRDLFISQAVLTGEALPVEKYDTLAAVAGKSAEENVSAASDNPLDQHNVCFMGTNVVSGTASAVVVATGSDTYFGSLAKAISGTRAQTSFDRGVNSVSWLLIRFMLVMVPIVFFINGFTKATGAKHLCLLSGGRWPDAGDAADDCQL